MARKKGPTTSSQAHCCRETIDASSIPDIQAIAPAEPLRIARMITTNAGAHGRMSFSETFATRHEPAVLPFSSRIDIRDSRMPGGVVRIDSEPFDHDDGGVQDWEAPDDVVQETFGARSLEPDEEGADGEGGSNQNRVYDCVEEEKRKGLDEWIPVRDSVLDQLVMLDGALLCDYRCACGRQALYRCNHCFGPLVQCESCIRSAHACQPFHFIEYWNGKFWQKISLANVDFELHLGHGGTPCPNPIGQGRLMHIIHTTGLHDIRVKFCGCMPSNGYTSVDQIPYNQLLRARLFPSTITTPTSAVTFECLNDFHLLTTQGKLTGMDYYESRVQHTDNPAIDPPKRKYEEFMKISRLWRHLKILKRAGVHLTAGGVNACEPGSCAMPCYACPSGNDELEIMELFGAPNDDPWWTSAAYRQLDANFRLKLKNRNLKDRSLNNGIAHIVKEEPYMEHIDKCGPQTEVNICDSGLHAVDHANLRGSAAYSASGVGACQCRHMMVMPAGVGDLQKGERYSNMDYIFASSMKSYTPERLVISYDISCQWSRNFETRYSNLPPHIKFNPNWRNIQYVIPKFHIAAHGLSCQSRYSLNFLRYMGRTDGENIERGWAWMNPASLSTREMGPGARADTLDDQWCSWNFRIATRLVTTLYRRLDESVLMARSQREAHTEFTKTFRPEVIEEWSKQVDEWCANPFDSKLVNPFEEPVSDMTTADIRRALNAEETNDMAGGTVPDHAISASRYLVAGLDLEDQQRTLKSRHANTRSTSTTRSLTLEDKEVELRRKILQWKRNIQPTYMPGLPSISSDVEIEDGLDDSAGKRTEEVWDIPLCLPSSFTREQRLQYCGPGVEDKERRLRVAQADDALDALRRVLRTVLVLDKHRGRQTAGSGVAANTRMQSLLSRHRAKQNRIVDRYRAARVALLVLDPTGATKDGGWGKRLRELNDSDIKPPKPPPGQSEGHYELTWIWRTQTGAAISPDDDEQGYEQSLRVDWAKSLARAERWEEEVVLIPIEMRRVLRNMVFRAREWRHHAQQASELSRKSTRVQAGCTAYSEKQAYILEELAQDYATLWLSLFKEYNINTPTGWPHMCSVERAVKRRVERRRDRVLAKRGVHVVEVSQ